MNTKERDIKFIAEIGINHNGSTSEAKKLIVEAKRSGCNYVKFQIRDINKIYHKDIKKKFSNSENSHQYIYNQLKKTNLSKVQNINLFKYSKKLGLKVIITPFDNSSANLCKNSLIDEIKIGSPDLENLSLIKKCINFNKPLVLSTGMSSEENILTVLKFLKKHKKKNQDITIMHCTSSYPPSLEELNIKYLLNLKKISKDFEVGYSGHERGYKPSLISIFFGARVIERHITLNKKNDGPDHNSSLTPKEFKEMIKESKKITKYLHLRTVSEKKFLQKFNLMNYKDSIGKNKKIISCNAEFNKKILGKSLIYKKNFKKGTILNLDSFKLVSPAKGITELEFLKLKNKVLKSDVKSMNYMNILDLRKKIKSDIKINRRWGLVGRLGDFEDYLDKKADLIEVHLTWRELLEPKKIRYKINKELIIHAPEYFDDKLIDFTSDDKKILNNSFEMIDNLKSLVEKIKDNFIYDERVGPKVILHPGGHSENTKDTIGKNIRYKNLNKNLEKIKSKNYNLLLENMPPYPWYFGGTFFQHVFTDSLEIKKFCKETNTNICYDTSHAILECNKKNLNFINFSKNLLDETQYFHISDGKNSSQEGVQIGFGDINFEKFFNLIKNKDVGFIPEIWNGHLNSGEGFKIALKSIEKILKKISTANHHH